MPVCFLVHTAFSTLKKVYHKVNIFAMFYKDYRGKVALEPKQQQPVFQGCFSFIFFRGEVYFLMSDQKLVSVEIQKEFDVLNKGWQEKVFVKLYAAARTTGFLADISDRDWKTLCVLATFMDTHGNCYPSQNAIASALNICRQAASERMSSLLGYRWQGKPVVTVAKYRKYVTSGKKGQRWDNNRYTILPLSNISFGRDKQSGIGNNNMEKSSEKIGEKPMSPNHDIGKNLDFTEEKPMSPYPDSGKDDTNKIHNRSVVVVDPDPRDEKKSNREKSIISSTVTDDVAAFDLPAGSEIDVCDQEEDREEKNQEHPAWEQLRAKVRGVAGANISVGFAREVCKRYKPEKITSAIKELERQLSQGVEIRGVGAWLRYALENDIYPDQPAKIKTILQKRQNNDNKPPRARPNSGCDRHTDAEKEFIRSLYLRE